MIDLELMLIDHLPAIAVCSTPDQHQEWAVGRQRNLTVMKNGGGGIGP